MRKIILLFLLAILPDWIHGGGLCCVTLGIYSDNGPAGWTTIVPSNGTNGASHLVSKLVYVSDSTGNDSWNGLAPDFVSGTTGPVKTIAKCVSLMTNTKPDWCLLRKGDTFVDQAFQYIQRSGASANEPMVFTSYGTGARPIVEVSTAVANQLAISSLVQGDYIAVIGIDFYAYRRDPANPSFNAANAHAGISGAFWLTNTHWLLFEDNVFRFFGDNIAITPIAPSLSQQVYIRRNIIEYAYHTAGAHSQGSLLGRAGTPVIEENLFNMNGWNQTLWGPNAVTIACGTPAVITWAGSFANPFQNGDVIAFRDLTGITGIAPDDGTGTVNGYIVAGLSGDTFNIQLSGVDQDCSGSAAAPTVIWADVQANVFNHNLYIGGFSPDFNHGGTHDQATLSVSTVRGNVFANDGAGLQHRSGGTLTDNLLITTPTGISTGSPSLQGYTATNNVFIEPGNPIPPYQPLGQAFNTINTYEGDSYTIGTFTFNGNIITNKAGASGSRGFQISPGITGAVINNNIVFNWDNPVQDSGTGTIDTNNNFDSGGTNDNPGGLAPSEPFSEPTRSVGSYAGNIGISLPTTACFIQARETMSKDNWLGNLTAQAVNNYIRGGFGR